MILELSCHGTTSPSRNLTGIVVTGTSSYSLGQSAQLTALASFSDGSSQNVSSTATWTSTNSSVATVSASGVVTATAVGGADVQARYMQVAGSLHLVVAGAVVGGEACGD